MPKIVTASFTERVSLQDAKGNWGSTEASISLTDEFPDSFNTEAMDAEAQGLTNRVKEQVWASLGIEFNLNDDGYLMKLDQTSTRTSNDSQSSPASRPANKSRATAPSKAAARSGAQSANHLDSDGFTTDGKQNLWDLAFQEGAAQHSWWVNTPKKLSGELTDKHPDLKHKDSNDAVWSNKAPLAVHGKDGVYMFKSGADTLEAILAGGESANLEAYLA